MRTRRLLTTIIFMLASTVATTWAQTPDNIISEIGFDQNLGVRLPLDLKFKDETGETIELGQYFKTKPVVLVLVYYECPMLCTQVLNGLAKTIRTTTLVPGADFEIVVASFDPRETPQLAMEKKKQYLKSYGLDGSSSGWHFLTGKEAEIEALTKSAGFRYAFDKETNQYAHASGIIVVTPQGITSRYFYGIEFSPRDLRLGLVEASGNKIGTLADQVLLYCYVYDPKAGGYGIVIMRLLRGAGIITVLLLAGFMLAMLRKDMKRISTPPERSKPC